VTSCICNRADLGARCHINTGTSWQENAIVTDICADGSRSHGVCNDKNNYKYIKNIFIIILIITNTVTS
jgi:hypothetical protein